MAFKQRNTTKVQATAEKVKSDHGSRPVDKRQTKQQSSVAQQPDLRKKQGKDGSVMRKVVITVVCAILALAMTIPSVAVMLARDSNSQTGSSSTSSSATDTTTFDSINSSWKSIIAYAASVSSDSSSTSSTSASASTSATSSSSSTSETSNSASSKSSSTSKSAVSASAESASASKSAASASTSATSTSGSASAESASASKSAASASSEASSASASGSTTSATDKDTTVASYHYYWAYELYQFVAGDGTTSGAKTADEINTNFQTVVDSAKNYQSTATDPDVYDEYLGTIYYNWIQALKVYSTISGDDTSAKVKLCDGYCINYLEKALDIKYSRATQGDLATAYFWNGDDDKAIETALKVVDGVTSLDDLTSESDKQSVLSAWVNLGIYYTDAGQTDKAKDAYNEVTTLDPDDKYGNAATVNQYLADLS